MVLKLDGSNMIEIKAPNSYEKYGDKIKIFLAGSIEMGAAEKWQDKAAKALIDKDVLILNPRRDDWDSSWKQTKDNKQFREQVEWELVAQEDADLILMYFDPNTKSPITLLELGLFTNIGRHLGTKQKVVVCCPEGFYRKGNVDIVCERYGILQVPTLDTLISFAAEAFK